MREEHSLGAADLRQARGEIVGRRRLAPLVVDRVHLAAEVRGYRSPALAEVTGRDDDHTVARSRLEIADSIPPV